MQIVRITRGRVQPGTWGQFEAALHDAYEKVGRIPGLVSRSLIQNVDDPDQGYAMSVWESAADMKSYEKGDLAKAVNPYIQKYFTGDYLSEYCEVRYWNATP